MKTTMIWAYVANQLSLQAYDSLHSDPLSLAIVDGKSVFDASATEQATGEDDASALEIAIIQDSLTRCQGCVRWVPHNRNPSDMLTKLNGAHEVKNDADASDEHIPYPR